MKNRRKGRRAKKKKGIETQRVDLPNPSQAIDVPIGDGEQNAKQKKGKERNRERVPNPATLDPSGATYDP